MLVLCQCLFYLFWKINFNPLIKIFSWIFFFFLLLSHFKSSCSIHLSRNARTALARTEDLPILELQKVSLVLFAAALPPRLSVIQDTSRSRYTPLFFHPNLCTAGVITTDESICLYRKELQQNSLIIGRGRRWIPRFRIYIHDCIAHNII